MCKIQDIAILVCSQEERHISGIKAVLKQLGIKKLFIAQSQEALQKIAGQNKIDIALIDIDFNGTGGIQTSEILFEKFPGLFILFFSDPKDVMGPVKTIFSNAVGFIFKNNDQEFKKKISTWITIARNARTVKEFVHGRC